MHAGLKRSLLGMHSEANNCEHGLRTTKIMASDDRYWGFGLLKDLVAKNFLKAGHRSWLAGCDRIQTWWNVFVYLACRDVLLVQSKFIGEHSWSEAREAQIISNFVHFGAKLHQAAICYHGTKLYKLNEAAQELYEEYWLLTRCLDSLDVLDSEVSCFQLA